MDQKIKRASVWYAGKQWIKIFAGSRLLRSRRCSTLLQNYTVPSSYGMYAVCCSCSEKRQEQQAASMAIQSAAARRPLVVLAGWLGSQPKSLRRYETLYRGLGFEVLTRIAPPYTIGREILHDPREPLPMPVGWPGQKRNDEKLSVRQLAWEILGEISRRQEQVDFWMFVGFSNGGCFVWERIRDILLQSEQEGPRVVDLRKKLSGVVFDSCPIIELHRFNDALRHCTLLERAAVLRHNGWDLIRMNYDTKMQKHLKQLGNDYANRVCNDPLDVPQLYLYGRDDPLCPAAFIDELVEHRRQIFGKHKILRCSWDTSIHCAHLLKHPQDYASAVESFVELCSSNLDLRSKL